MEVSLEKTFKKRSRKPKLSKEELMIGSGFSDFITCHNCGNTQLEFIENHSFDSEDEGELITRDVFFCPICHCLAWEEKDTYSAMFWPNIKNMEEWEKNRGIVKAINWVSDQELARRKN